MRNEDQYKAWLCLKTAPEIGFKTALRIVDTYGDPQTFVGKADHDIYLDKSIGKKALDYLASATLPKAYPQICKLCEHYGIEYLLYSDEDYPPSLKEIFSPPLILYYRGNLSKVMDNIRLAVVGTRKPSPYGRELCKKLILPLTERGVCIVSGLAMGIDAIAHASALQGGSQTLAVLAGGIEDVYPPINRELAKKIVQNGALLSEYEPGSRMERWNFPARNRLISALSMAVFIVEGALSSGALLTAKFAIEQNRDILALPGNINISNAQGPNYLIKSGAAMITCSEDIMRILGMEENDNEQIEIFPDLSDNEKIIYELMKNEQRTLSFDELMLLSHNSFGQLSIALLNLELKSLIAKSGGNAYLVL